MCQSNVCACMTCLLAQVPLHLRRIVGTTTASVRSGSDLSDKTNSSKHIERTFDLPGTGMVHVTFVSGRYCVIVHQPPSLDVNLGRITGPRVKEENR